MQADYVSWDSNVLNYLQLVARTDAGLLFSSRTNVVTYLDLLAHRAGIDLAAATISKWNRVSERVGSSVRLGSDDPEEKP